MDDALTVMVVDDESIALSRLRKVLEKMGFNVQTFLSPVEALESMKQVIPHVVITDVKMPEVDGIELLQRIKALSEITEVIVITGYATLDMAIEVTRKGGFYYLSKPIKLDQLRLIVEKAVEKVMLSVENSRLRNQIKQRYRFRDMVSDSEAMGKIFDTIEKIAKLDCSVILQGESGTGKEMIARSIHQKSLRQQKPFISFNCASFSEELMANELFGHERGAFTGAESIKKGLLEAADQGTLFLDEVADMPMSMQVKLLRVLQERVLLRVGGIKEVKIDISVIAATNKDIKTMVENEQFRKDLFYRLNVVFIDIPPLRERREDIPLLITHFIKKYSGIFNKQITQASREFEGILLDYSFPGNVRELENIIERAIALTDERELSVNDLPADIRLLDITSLPASEVPNLKQHEEDYITKIYASTGKNHQKTADLLGISRTTLWRKLKMLGITEGSEKL